MTEEVQISCAEVREMLPAFARESEPSLALRRHLSRCPECTAELGRYRRLTSALQALESHTVEPPAGLRSALVGIPSEAGRIDAIRGHVARNRRVYAGGAAVALAGAAGAALWQVRRHRVAAA